MELSINCLTKLFGRKLAVDCVSAKLGPGLYGLLGGRGCTACWGPTALARPP